MTSITVRDIPEEVYRKIKENAEANKRSINSEILYGLERNYSEYKQNKNKEATLIRLKKLRDKTKGKVYLSDVDIQKAKQEGRD